MVKHFSPGQAERTSTPIWITNEGLESEQATLSFDELHQNVLALFEVCRETFVEIPKEAHERRSAQAARRGSQSEGS